MDFSKSKMGTGPNAIIRIAYGSWHWDGQRLFVKCPRCETSQRVETRIQAGGLSESAVICCQIHCANRGRLLLESWPDSNAEPKPFNLHEAQLALPRLNRFAMDLPASNPVWANQIRQLLSAMRSDPKVFEQMPRENREAIITYAMLGHAHALIEHEVHQRVTESDSGSSS